MRIKNVYQSVLYVSYKMSFKHWLVQSQGITGIITLGVVIVALITYPEAGTAVLEAIKKQEEG